MNNNNTFIKSFNFNVNQTLNFLLYFLQVKAAEIIIFVILIRIIDQYY